MDLSFTPEQQAFRKEVRSWIAQAMPPEMKRKADAGASFHQDETMEWHRILYAKGWIAPHWPKEVGGTGWDVGRRFIFQEEIVRANTPELSPFGLSMVGPLLIQFGNAEQKQRFLPKIRSGEEVWCQGYSEPNSGSDLASLQLRAVKDGAEVEIRVADSGPGVPAEMRERVFDRFVQLGGDATVVRRGGRGLGLAFCKMAVEAHGGRIWVEDNAPGAIFCVRLPDEE